MIITLNPVEQFLVYDVAVRRQDSNKRKKVTDKKKSKRSDLDITIEGVAGEVAFCKFLGIYPDLQYTDYRKCDVIKGGHRFDIKTTASKVSGLVVAIHKKAKDSDYHVLVCGKMPRYEIIGYAKTSDVICDERIGDIGYGPSYFYPRDKIEPFKDK